MKLGNLNGWDDDGTTISDLSRAKYDDEAVTLRQMKEITDKKIDTDSLLPQKLKSRLLMPDYDSDKDVVVKKYVENKTFPLDVSKGLGMKGNKVINVVDPTSATDESNKRYVDTKTSSLLKQMVPRVMTGDLNMNSRRVINVKQAQSHESTHVADVNFVATTMNNSNLLMTANYQKYVNDILNHSVGSTNQKKMFRYLMDNRSSEFSDEVHVTGVKITKNDFLEVKKETNEMKLHLDLSKGYQSSRVGLNMYSLPTGEYTVVFELYFPSPSINYSTVRISATSSNRTVSRTSTNLCSDHSRSIIHLHKYNNTTPNYLMTDMVLKNKSGISYMQDLIILVIVYSISGFHNDVLLSVWDKIMK